MEGGEKEGRGEGREGGERERRKKQKKEKNHKDYGSNIAIFLIVTWF